jgi:hypothetical protein
LPIPWRLADKVTACRGNFFRRLKEQRMQRREKTMALRCAVGKRIVVTQTSRTLPLNLLDSGKINAHFLPA